MSDVIDLGAERSKREQPDPEFVIANEFGRPMFTFLLEYQMEGRKWSAEILAYSFEDADERVRAMGETLSVCGKLFKRFEG